MRRYSIGFTCFLLAITAAVFFSWMEGTLPQLAAEEGPLEKLHMVLLAAASLAYFRSYLGTIGFWKTAAGILTIGLAGACLREFDFKLYPDIEWLQTIKTHHLQYLALFIVTLPILINVVRNHTDIPAAIGLGLSPKAWPFMFGGALVGFALLMDRLQPAADVNHVAEELLETYGYAFLVLAALRHYPLAERDGATRAQLHESINQPAR
jgi:hypothetical protein